jgi:hypothetical protein
LKNFVLISFLSVLPLYTSAQSHAVKGIIFGYPKLYFMGAGYEVALKNNFSVQISWLHYGFDERNTDGPVEHTHTLAPEVRYYLGNTDSLTDKFFVGIFSELTKINILPGGEQAPNYFLVSGAEKMISPGMLVGRNISFPNRMYIEVFFGGKYRFIHSERTYFDNQKEEIVVDYVRRPGLRAGIFLGYTF